MRGRRLVNSMLAVAVVGVIFWVVFAPKDEPTAGRLDRVGTRIERFLDELKDEVLGPKSFNAVAKSAGYSAYTAEQAYFRRPTVDTPTYTSSLSELLKIEPALTKDPEVTFWFGPCNAEGFTLETRHTRGDRSFTFTN